MANYIADNIDRLIEQATSVAAEKSSASDSRSNLAIMNAMNYRPITWDDVRFTPADIPFPVDIPRTASVDASPQFQAEWSRIHTALVADFATFFATYFPDHCNYLQHAQEWICNAIVNGGIGLPLEVEEQIWQRDRSRVLREQTKQEEEAMVTWAGRRYPLPPGAAIAHVQAIRAASADKIAQASRDVAIKVAEIHVDTVKFAVEQAIKLRLGAVAAAADYIKALAVGPEIASKLSLSTQDAQAKLISAASDYYRSRVALEELKFKVVQLNADSDVRVMTADQDAFMKSAGNITQAAVAGAQSAGTQAAAALNSLSTHVSAQGSGALA